MKKVIPKSRRKRNEPTRHERRVRAWRKRLIEAQNGTAARRITGEKASVEDKAFLDFVCELVRPQEERGDHYMRLLNDIAVHLHKLDGDSGFLNPEQIAKNVEAMVEHYLAIRDGLNYDDLRTSLAWIVNNRERLIDLLKQSTPTQRTWYDARKALETWIKESGAVDALAGAPLSDVGAMRDVLRMADHLLTRLVKTDESRLRPTEALMVWQVINAARKAVQLAPTPTETDKLRAEFRATEKIVFETCQVLETHPSGLPARAAQIEEERVAFRWQMGKIAAAVMGIVPSEQWGNKGLLGAAEALIRGNVSLTAFLAETEQKLKISRARELKNGKKPPVNLGKVEQQFIESGGRGWQTPNFGPGCRPISRNSGS